MFSLVLKVSWTEALRTIVKNCYKHHGREDLLHVFSDEATVAAQAPTAHFPGTVVQTITNPDGSVSIIHIDTAPHATNNNIITLPDGTQATVVQTVSPPQQVGCVDLGWHCENFNFVLYMESLQPGFFFHICCAYRFHSPLPLSAILSVLILDRRWKGQWKTKPTGFVFSRTFHLTWVKFGLMKYIK